MVDLGFFVRDGLKKWYYLSRRLDMHTIHDILGLAIILCICGGGAVGLAVVAQIATSGRGKKDHAEHSAGA